MNLPGKIQYWVRVYRPRRNSNRREKDIAIEQVKAEGKPAEMAEKIALGKINKFFKESTLLAQPFVKDSNKSVADYLKSIDADLKITAFKRVALG